MIKYYFKSIIPLFLSTTIAIILQSEVVSAKTTTLESNTIEQKEQKEQKQHGHSKKETPSVKSSGKIANFDLDREITINGSESHHETVMFCNRIAELLRSVGCDDVKISRSKGKYNINIEKVDMIIGVDSTIHDAFCMKVYKDDIHLQYMSTKSMAWAYQALRKIIVEHQTLLQKAFNSKSLFVQASSLCETTGATGGFEIIDIVDTKMSVTAFKNYISRAALNNKFVIYMKVVSTKGVAVKSELINSVNPFIELASGGMSYGELNELNSFATENGIELIPMLDFVTEENEYFENYTGHKIHSTEGLRFSKAMINEFAIKTNYEVICIGGEPTNREVKEKYIDPLVELFNTYDRDVVIHSQQ